MATLSHGNSVEIIEMEREMHTAKIHLSTDELAARWGMSPGTLANWRIEGKGPRFIKLGRKVLYRLGEIESYEASHIKASTF